MGKYFIINMIEMISDIDVVSNEFELDENFGQIDFNKIEVIVKNVDGLSGI